MRGSFQLLGGEQIKSQLEGMWKIAYGLQQTRQDASQQLGLGSRSTEMRRGEDGGIFRRKTSTGPSSELHMVLRPSMGQKSSWEYKIYMEICAITS